MTDFSENLSLLKDKDRDLITELELTFKDINTYFDEIKNLKN